MPYDLYGTYYKSSREAEAAEISQIQYSFAVDAIVNFVHLQYINMLEERIAALEKQT